MFFCLAIFLAASSSSISCSTCFPVLTFFFSYLKTENLIMYFIVSEERETPTGKKRMSKSKLKATQDKHFAHHLLYLPP